MGRMKELHLRLLESPPEGAEHRGDTGGDELDWAQVLLCRPPDSVDPLPRWDIDAEAWIEWDSSFTLRLHAPGDIDHPLALTEAGANALLTGEMDWRMFRHVNESWVAGIEAGEVLS